MVRNSDAKRFSNNFSKFFYKDYEKLAEILLQRPIEFNTRHVSTALTDKELAYLQEMAKKHFDIVLKTLRQMPKNMLFVVR